MKFASHRNTLTVIFFILSLFSYHCLGLERLFNSTVPLDKQSAIVWLGEGVQVAVDNADGGVFYSDIAGIQLDANNEYCHCLRMPKSSRFSLIRLRNPFDIEPLYDHLPKERDFDLKLKEFQISGAHADTHLKMLVSNLSGGEYFLRIEGVKKTDFQEDVTVESDVSGKITVKELENNSFSCDIPLTNYAPAAAINITGGLLQIEKCSVRNGRESTEIASLNGTGLLQGCNIVLSIPAELFDPSYAPEMSLNYGTTSVGAYDRKVSAEIPDDSNPSGSRISFTNEQEETERTSSINKIEFQKISPDLWITDLGRHSFQGENPFEMLFYMPWKTMFGQQFSNVDAMFLFVGSDYIHTQEDSIPNSGNVLNVHRTNKGGHNGALEHSEMAEIDFVPPGAEGEYSTSEPRRVIKRNSTRRYRASLRLGDKKIQVLINGIEVDISAFNKSIEEYTPELDKVCTLPSQNCGKGDRGHIPRFFMAHTETGALTKVEMPIGDDFEKMLSSGYHCIDYSHIQDSFRFNLVFDTRDAPGVRNGRILDIIINAEGIRGDVVEGKKKLSEYFVSQKIDPAAWFPVSHYANQTLLSMFVDTLNREVFPSIMPDEYPITMISGTEGSLEIKSNRDGSYLVSTTSTYPGLTIEKEVKKSFLKKLDSGNYKVTKAARGVRGNPHIRLLANKLEAQSAFLIGPVPGGYAIRAYQFSFNCICPALGQIKADLTPPHFKSMPECAEKSATDMSSDHFDYMDGDQREKAISNRTSGRIDSSGIIKTVASAKPPFSRCNPLCKEYMIEECRNTQANILALRRLVQMHLMMSDANIIQDVIRALPDIFHVNKVNELVGETAYFNQALEEKSTLIALQLVQFKGMFGSSRGALSTLVPESFQPVWESLLALGACEFLKCDGYSVDKNKVLEECIELLVASDIVMDKVAPILSSASSVFVQGNYQNAIALAKSISKDCKLSFDIKGLKDLAQTKQQEERATYIIDKAIKDALNIGRQKPENQILISRIQKILTCFWKKIDTNAKQLHFLQQVIFEFSLLECRGQPELTKEETPSDPPHLLG